IVPALIGLLTMTAQLAMAQDLEPRRWSHLPVGANFASIGYGYTEFDIFVDPTLQLEDVTGDVHTGVLAYVRALDVFGKTGQIDVLLPYSAGRWEGLLEGEPASTRRHGFNDPRVRFAVNLLGSPAQRGAEFVQPAINTILGVAVEVSAPLGEYKDDKLINLGSNRWMVRPQIGVIHNRNKWAAELTASVRFYTDNDDFNVDQTRKQDPMGSVQAHLIYTFKPGLWASLSGAYGSGGQNEIDDIEAGDRIGKYLLAASAGFSISSRQGFKFAYMRGVTTENTGNDYDRFLFGYSMMWGGR
ncbi:MAG: transporter, partial [Gammaproteobacteria bacterium]